MAGTGKRAGYAMTSPYIAAEAARLRLIKTCVYCDLKFPRDRKDGDIFVHVVGNAWSTRSEKFVECTRRDGL